MRRMVTTTSGCVMYEVERKFPVNSFDEIRSRLTALDCHFAEPVVQVDRYFAHPQRDFAQTDEALRIRSVGDRHRVTYKGPRIDRVTKTRREIELPLGPGSGTAEKMAEVFLQLGFREVATVRKQRTTADFTWNGMPIEVALDRVDQVGTFVELESMADETTLDSVRHQLNRLAQHLGLQESERRSYLELLLARRNET